MEVYFMLDDKCNPLPESDIQAWIEWFEKANRGIARTVVTPEVTVLTFFKGYEETPDDSPLEQPKLFETRVFGGALNEEEVLSSSRDQALAIHRSTVDWCRTANQLNYGIKDSEDGLS